ncbi:MAG: hypothetical protein IPN38_10610 [Flavobacteriales bacterium]|nr:hypothetical protein [Flavobacteriales bacterium]
MRTQLKALGRASRDERIAGIVFACTALLWMTGDDIVFSEAFTLHGWRGWLGLQRMSDPAVGMLGGLVLFVLPSKGEAHFARLGLRAAARIPWGVVL